MSEPIIDVARISGVIDPGGDTDAYLLLESGGTFLLPRQSPFFETWRDVSKRVKARGAAIYVEADPVGLHITRILLPSLRRVLSLRRLPEPACVEVLFTRSPSGFYLRAGRSKRFELSLRVLEASMERGIDVLVTDELETTEIVEARLPLSPTGTSSQDARS